MVAQIPTRFGRLVFLCSLRESASGRYSHPALTERFGAEAADRTLCHSHHLVFMEWLRLSLADQKADLEEYLRSMGFSSKDLRYRELVPPSAHEVERMLYIADFEVVLQLISFEEELAYDRNALPRR